MRISKVKTVFFSPTGNAESVADFMGDTFADLLDAELIEISYTLPKEREAFKDAYREGISENGEGTELLIWVTPVYAGRIPNKTLDFVKEAIQFVAEQKVKTYAIPVVVYGNRSFDNALAELTGIFKDNHIQPIAGAALTSEHAFASLIGKDRPDQSDFEEMKSFCEFMAGNIKNDIEMDCEITVQGDEHPTKYYTPLKTDLMPANFLKAKPQINGEQCDACGSCAEACPMGSIIMEKYSPRIVGTCIKCQACIKTCPQGSIYFYDEDFLSHKKMLEENYLAKNDNYFFM